MCRQLGFPATGTIIIIIIMIRHFSLFSLSLSLSLSCSPPLPLGAETYITDCHNNGYYVHNCAHAEDAGVQCAGIVYQS